MNYADQPGRQADFEVRYRFYTSEEGGRQSGPPWQHVRCDWSYEGDDIAQTGIFMVWPEFTAEDGSVQPEGAPVPWSGTATMWIVVPDMRGQVHQHRICEGVRGFFMEGSRRVAEAVVTRVIALHSNPVERPHPAA